MCPELRIPRKPSIVSVKWVQQFPDEFYQKRFLLINKNARLIFKPLLKHKYKEIYTDHCYIKIKFSISNCDTTSDISFLRRENIAFNRKKYVISIFISPSTLAFDAVKFTIYAKIRINNSGPFCQLIAYNLLYWKIEEKRGNGSSLNSQLISLKSKAFLVFRENSETKQRDFLS